MSLNAHLVTLVEDAVAALPAVTMRKMFGCEAWFARDQVFALVWKAGRVGVKLPDAAAFEELMARPGADPWQPGGKMTMSHWVLVPEALHDNADELARWVEKAHAFALTAPPKAKGKAADAKGKVQLKAKAKAKAAKKPTQPRQRNA